MKICGYLKKLCGLKTLLVLSLLLLTQNAFAITVDIFNPPAIANGSDVSITLLGQIFGSVDGVLYGFGSEILGAMFYVFNSATMALGGIIVLYTLVVSTLNTANEGEVLGRKWNSMWIPFRSAVGIALLLPKASGYSMIQIFVMWVVVQGVAAADTMWNTAIEYIEGAGTVMPTTFDYNSVDAIVAKSMLVLNNEVCLYSEQNKYNSHPEHNQVNLQPGDPQTVSSGGKTTYYVYFPGESSIPNPNPDGFTTTDCGSMSWGKETDARYNEAKEAAIWQMVLDLESYGQQVAHDGAAQACPNDYLPCPAALAMQDATLDYIGIMDPATQAQNTSANVDLRRQLQATNSQGWILAGSYYQVISDQHGARKSIAGALPTIEQPGKQPNPLSGREWNQVQATMASITPKMMERTAKDISKGASSNALPDFSFQSLNDNQKFIMNSFTIGMTDVFTYWKNAFSDTNVDPIYAVVSLGNQIIDRVFWMWFTISLLIYVLGLIQGIMSCVQPLGLAFETWLAWFVPMASMIMGLLFTAGAVMAFYVPFIPFILFLFGGIGWFLAVIESMVAAPLVALGITHPEGHEVYGRADPAVMLLVNVFLRPSLMIIGLIAGILLSFVGLKLLNLGFGPAVANLADPNTTERSDLFRQVAIVLVYTSIVLLIINKAFSLIHEIPNKVLRWVGGAEQLGDSSVDLHAVQGAVSSGASTVGKGAEAGIAGSHASGQARGKQAREDAEKAAGASGGGIEGVG